ncbi:sorting nexin-8 [Chanos chanos]|uniref:Sorting nexin-8 n=1 Tax=Chanos chanos TaxID=29144 RepID=A0A6J2VT81_CHACN|nr:sorting nexin-8-like [Chanos chanos]
MRLVNQGPVSENPSLEDLLRRDGVVVEIVPEKKGLLFLKHVEYRLISKCFKVAVHRRYSDFDVFHSLLLQRFIYRMVPPLPPKRIFKGVLNSMSEREFIEVRCRGLQRFMTLVMRHPVISEDELLIIFMTASSADVQIKLREAFKRTGDEYMMYQMSSQCRVHFPDDIHAQTASSREVVENLLASFHRLRNMVERMAQRSRENSTDLLMFGKDLSSLGSETSHPPPSTPSGVETPSSVRKTQRPSLGEEFNLLAEKAAKQGSREANEVVEKLNVFLEMLQSYKDLCVRHESGVFLEHQSALQKHNMNSVMCTRDQRQTDQLESRIAQQENAIVTMEMRSYFSLHCLHQETQYVFMYLPHMLQVLGDFVHSQIQGHKEMHEVWSELHPKLTKLYEGTNKTPMCPLNPLQTPNTQSLLHTSTPQSLLLQTSSPRQRRTTAIFSQFCPSEKPDEKMVN